MPHLPYELVRATLRHVGTAELSAMYHSRPPPPPPSAHSLRAVATYGRSYLCRLSSAGALPGRDGEGRHSNWIGARDPPVDGPQQQRGAEGRAAQGQPHGRAEERRGQHARLGLVTRLKMVREGLIAFCGPCLNLESVASQRPADIFATFRRRAALAALARRNRTWWGNQQPSARVSTVSRTRKTRARTRKLLTAAPQSQREPPLAHFLSPKTRLSHSSLDDACRSIERATALKGICSRQTGSLETEASTHHFRQSWLQRVSRLRR